MMAACVSSHVVYSALARDSSQVFQSSSFKFLIAYELDMVTSPLWNLNSLVHSLVYFSIKFKKVVAISKQDLCVPYHCPIMYHGDITQSNKSSAVCNNLPLNVAVDLCHIEFSSGAEHS
jgi:hypothetical protein